MNLLTERLQRASKLSLADWMLTLEAWCCLLFFDIGLRTIPFKNLQKIAANLPKRVSQTRRYDMNRIIAAVDRARFHHLYPMTCLRRALCLQKMLAWQGIKTELKIGVRKENDDFGAHAWLEIFRKPLAESENMTGKFVTLYKDHSE